MMVSIRLVGGLIPEPLLHDVCAEFLLPLQVEGGQEGVALGVDARLPHVVAHTLVGRWLEHLQAGRVGDY